jgi:hypothetical protein
VASAGRHGSRVVSKPPCLPGNALGHAGVELHRRKARQRSRVDAHTFGRGQLGDEAGHALLGLLQQGFVGVAQVHR